jgi:hypothetical protein
MKINTGISELARSKSVARAYLQSLSPEDKIAKLLALQQQYYSMLAIREANDGKPIPDKWKKWHAARSEAKK